MYKVSVLVPVYNVEQYIERCSRSLFEQTYNNLEFLFVDDCSLDNSIPALKEVISSYPTRKNLVKIIRHERNKGLAASRNTGLYNSTGSFLICVDSDDWIELNTIELLVNRQMDSCADIVSGNCLIHFNNEQCLHQERVYENKEQMVLQMMQHTWDHFIAGRLVRRSLFIDNMLHWKEGLDIAEDRYMMTLLAFYAKSFDSVDSIVYNYEQRNLNAITKATSAHKILKNNRQELGNVLSLEQFFKDKDSVLQDECTRCVMQQLAYNLQSALECSSKDEYYNVLSLINNRDDKDLRIIDWDNKGLKGWIIHRYGYVQLSRLMEKGIRHFRRILR